MLKILYLSAVVALLLLIISSGSLAELRLHSKRDAKPLNKTSSNRITDQTGGYEANEISADRIQVAEPVKQMAKTLTRFALVQSRLANHIGIENAMELISNSLYVLSKPSNLLKALKMIGASLTALMVAVFLFPNIHSLAEAVWRNPDQALNLEHHFSNGLSTNGVVEIVTSRADEMLQQIGLSKISQREKSLCYLGEGLRCAFPHTTEQLVRFFEDNFSNIKLFKKNRYLRVFNFGLVDRNCSKTEEDFQHE